MMLKRLYKIIRNLPQLYRYGGVTQLNISSIQYGGHLFREEDLVLVTGGTSGIGYAIAKRFYEEGASVVVTGRNREKLDQVEMSFRSPRFKAVQWDVSDLDLIEKKINEIERETGKEIRILINNAGTYATSNFPNVTSDDWDRVYLTNLKGMFFLSQHMVNHWMNAKSDKMHKIINIASQGGFVGANNAYRMTKWDIRGFTQHLGKEYSSKGILANAIAPGIIQTDMQPAFQKQGGNVYTDLNPAHRIGLPLEIAELAIFLATDAANFIVGETICCDGGYTLK